MSEAVAVYNHTLNHALVIYPEQLFNFGLCFARAPTGSPSPLGSLANDIALLNTWGRLLAPEHREYAAGIEQMPQVEWICFCLRFLPPPQ